MAKSFDALVRRATTRRTPERAARRTQELLEELLLGELRKAFGKTQEQLATELGMKQPSWSKLEKQRDMQISTLRDIVETLGGKLVLIARFPRGAVKLTQFGKRIAVGQAPSPKSKRSHHD